MTILRFKYFQYENGVQIEMFLLILHTKKNNMML